ncbi:MFS transporter [Plebeiibacterium marinum]|uniref:MFS transporter n=1 Tax=Plebeiibacterium marinum TaxID=2992111 RepID=A0AAE3SKN4_9BACT|nr:MFS transporter [Plebeiobacterium marinum]MCW3806604.1 MFS transporter [Plebeiobacterium marinum]
MLKEIRKNPMYWYLLLLTIAITAGFQAWRTMFNNYAVDDVGVNGFQVGVIQSVREVPGFLAMLVVYLLLIIKEHKLAALGTLILGIGVTAAGVFPSFTGLVFTTLIMSLGFHYFETVNQSLTLQHFSLKEAPVVIGSIKSYGALTNIIVGCLIWFVSKHFELSHLFMGFGVVVVIAALYAFTCNPIKREVPSQQKKMVLKRKYWLFYVLNFLSGARRQVFVVFVVFMLVEKYQFKIEGVAVLFVANNIVNYFMAPLVGKGINRFGERVVLTMEYVSLIIVFLGYAFIEDKTMMIILYIANNIFYSASMAINTYFQKTGEPQDIAPSMAVGFTINHISAVVIPVVGGALWMLNWRIPFIAGAGIAVLSLFFAQKVKVLKNN